MKKRVEKHIKNQDFVKVYLADKDDLSITHFEGFIFEQSDRFILMSDTTDFNYDGIVVLRKSDISEIKHKENERFFKKILDDEKITELIFTKRDALNFSLSTFEDMFEQLQSSGLSIIIECKYSKDDRFLIGPIVKTENKRVRLKYFNANGEFDLKPTSAKYKEITFFKIDSPYANIFYKYAKDIE
jgi:hypothetical protein